MLLCNECGSELASGLVFCTNCGARAGVAPAFPDETTQVRGRPEQATWPVPPPTLAAVLPPAIVVPTPPAQPARRSLLPWLVALFSVVLLGVAIVALLVLRQTAGVGTGTGGGVVRITANASSRAAPYRGENTGVYYNYEATQALDGDVDTAWVEGVGGPGLGEWLQCDFGREVTLRQITLTPGYFKSTDIWLRNNRLARATFTFSNGTSQEAGFDDVMEQQTVDVGGVKTRWVRLSINDIYAGNRPEGSDTAISEISFECDECK